MAKLFGCSARNHTTTYITAWATQEMIEYSVISNQDLDKIVKNFVDEFPWQG